MSYRHSLIEQFSDCAVSVSRSANWRTLDQPRRFASLGSAIEHLMNMEADLSLTVVTAHASDGDVDLSPREVNELASLFAALRDCQD